MIILNNKVVCQLRKGETKGKRIGKLMHNPDVSGPAENRQPFVYLDGIKLTAEDCESIAKSLREMAGAHQFNEFNKRRTENS